MFYNVELAVRVVNVWEGGVVRHVQLLEDDGEPIVAYPRDG
jgi:hypothetical protein